MAFRVPLFDRSTTSSDEGYKVTFVSWEMLRYQSGDLSLDFFIEAGAGKVLIERGSMRTLSREAARNLDEKQIKQVLERIQAALEWRGWVVAMFS